MPTTVVFGKTYQFISLGTVAEGVKIGKCEILSLLS